MTVSASTGSIGVKARPAFGTKVRPGRALLHLALVGLVLLWTIPTLGLFVSSFRDKDQLINSGWWSAFFSTEQASVSRTGTDWLQTDDGTWTISGTLFDEGQPGAVQTFGDSVNDPREFVVGNAIDFEQGSTFVVFEDGTYLWTSDDPFEMRRGERISFVAEVPPIFTFDNYIEVLTSEGLGQSFLNTLTVTVPATVIPILIAAFAAYAFAWMTFPGRQLLFAVVVGLLVVPLQMSLIPLLRMYNGIGDMFGVPAQSYLGIWMAHTGFGLPLAIYLLRNYIGSLPRDIIESAKVDGATHFHIFTRLVLPLSVPALASFAIFQFLWVWNDLLVALVFLGKQDDQIVMTSKLRELLGSRGDNWEILTSSAFVSIIVPLIVFFALQRYFVRGLMAGSVKGG